MMTNVRTQDSVRRRTRVSSLEVPTSIDLEPCYIGPVAGGPDYTRFIFTQAPRSARLVWVRSITGQRCEGAGALLDVRKGVSIVKPGERNRVGAIVLFLSLSSLVLLSWAGGASAITPPLGTDRGEVLRRLALDPFAYVAETDIDVGLVQQGDMGYTGAAAVVDSATDALDARPSAGASLQGVAVAPDGARFFMTDAYQPILHVFDAETQKEIGQIELPGVEPRDAMWMVEALKDGTGKFPFSAMSSCSSHVACTPDGRFALVVSSAGLQVVDLTQDKVVRTLAGLSGGPVAISFDGKRAYVADDNLGDLPPRGFLEWMQAIMKSADYRLVCIDLETWEIVAEIPTAAVAGLAVKPDDSQVFVSESYRKLVRVVDASTFADLWSVSTEPSYSVGIGFVPDGTKAYVVCSADTGFLDVASGAQTPSKLPQAEDYFCAVIDTVEKEIVKRIPLEAY